MDGLATDFWRGDQRRLVSNASSIAKFAAKFEDAAKALPNAQHAAVTRCAEATKVAFLAAPGAPHKVAGKRASVGYDVSDSPSGARAVVRWRGPVHLVNNPTKPHEIRPRAFKGTRGRGKRAQRAAGLLAAFGLDAREGGTINIAGIGPRARAMHPGTPGKHFFQAGKATAEKIVPGIYKREATTTLAKTFKG